jgi:hypothetical protein
MSIDPDPLASHRLPFEADSWLGYAVQDYDPSQNSKNLDGVIYRVRQIERVKGSQQALLNSFREGFGKAVSGGDFRAFIEEIRKRQEEFEHDEIIPGWEALLSYLSSPGSADTQGLIVGISESEDEEIASDSMVTLCRFREQIPNLQALALAHIAEDDLPLILKSFPNLKYLSLGYVEKLPPLEHSSLKSLVIESGVATAELRSISASNVPSLESLELSFGAKDEDFDDLDEDPDEEAETRAERGDLQRFFENIRFPKLKRLGLCNSYRAGDIAEMAVTSPLMDQLQALDLSRGTLEDQGAEALLQSEKLKVLDLHCHFISPETMQRFKLLGINVDLRGRQLAGDGDEDERLAFSESDLPEEYQGAPDPFELINVVAPSVRTRFEARQDRALAKNASWRDVIHHVPQISRLYYDIGTAYYEFQEQEGRNVTVVGKDEEGAVYEATQGLQPPSEKSTETLQEVVDFSLPKDFIEFYQAFDGGHLHLRNIISWYSAEGAAAETLDSRKYSSLTDKDPRNILRFAEIHESPVRYALRADGKGNWHVVNIWYGESDDHDYKIGADPEQMAPLEHSFTEWLRWLVATDGGTTDGVLQSATRVR